MLKKLILGIVVVLFLIGGAGAAKPRAVDIVVRPPLRDGSGIDEICGRVDRIPAGWRLRRWWWRAAAILHLHTSVWIQSELPRTNSVEDHFVRSRRLPERLRAILFTRGTRSFRVGQVDRIVSSVGCGRHKAAARRDSLRTEAVAMDAIVRVGTIT